MEGRSVGSQIKRAPFCQWTSPLHSTIHGILCHVHNSATYPILRHMLGYTHNQQLHH